MYKKKRLNKKTYYTYVDQEVDHVQILQSIVLLHQRKMNDLNNRSKLINLLFIIY